MRRIIIIVLLIIPILSIGQLTPHATLYMYNDMMINPGYAGMSDGVNISSLFRSQWMGYEGAPSTQNFSANMPFKLFSAEHGVGLTLMNDKAGFDKNIGLSLNYSYHKEIAEGKLGIGVGVGFINQTLTPQWKAIDGTNDPLIPTGSDKPMIFDVNIGSYYKTNKLFLGVSLNHLNAPEVKYKDLSGNYPYYRRSAFLTFGYSYQLGNPLFELQPSIMIYTSGSAVQFSIDGILKYKNRFWGGFGYRMIDATSVILGAEIIEGLNVGMAYDLPTSQVIHSTAGSFEISIQYIFKVGIEKDNFKYKSVRYL